MAVCGLCNMVKCKIWCSVHPTPQYNADNVSEALFDLVRGKQQDMDKHIIKRMTTAGEKIREKKYWEVNAHTSFLKEFQHEGVSIPEVERVRYRSGKEDFVIVFYLHENK